MTTTCAKVIKAIGNKHLNLHRGDGYQYFVYDDGDLFSDHPVYVNRLNHLSFEDWIKIGADFVAFVEGTDK